MKYDKQKALNIIIKATEDYQKYLQNKQFLILYQNEKSVESAKVCFRGNHFLHLTGVETDLTASRFYEKCIHKKLSVKEFDLDSKGKAQRKLAVLPYLGGLLYHDCLIGNFINSGVYIQADYFVGNTKAVLSVGFRNGRNADYPVTLYKEDIRKLSYPTCKILAIFRKEYSESYYSTCTYLSKGQELHKLHLPEELKNIQKVFPFS